MSNNVHKNNGISRGEKDGIGDMENLLHEKLDIMPIYTSGRLLLFNTFASVSVDCYLLLRTCHQAR